MVVTTERASLWRHSDFLKLWTSETISAVGSQFSGLAIPLTAIYLLQSQCAVSTGPDACAFEFGIFAFVGTLPFLLIGLLVGVWVDRHHRRPILVLSNLGRCLLLAAIPTTFFLGFLGVVGFPFLYAVSFLIGVLTVFFDVAYQAYLPSLVERDQIPDANSKLETSRSTAQLVGPSLAGAAIDLITAPITIIVDVFAFLGSALSLSRIRHSDTIPPPQQRQSVRSEIREGLSVVFGDKRLWSIAGSTGTSNFFSSAAFALFLLYARNILGLTAFLIGLVFSVGSIGALVGAATALRVTRRVGVGRAIVLSMALGGLGSSGIYFAAVFSSTSISIGNILIPGSMLVLVAALLVTFWSTVVYNVNQVSLRQSLVPLRLQGRLNATMRFLVWGTLPLGGIIGGALGANIGIHNTIGIASLGGSFAFLWVLLSPVRSLREIPPPKE